MTKETIMDALNRCEPYVIPDCCAGCPYNGCWDTKEECITQLHSDAHTLLKAQEPRVISYDEIDNYEVLYLEVLDVDTEDGLAPWVKTKSGHWFSPLLCSDAQPEMTLCTSDEYMRICRCWTSRPTDEQREATPWTKR